MARRLLIRGGTLVDRAGVRRGDVLIDDERIAAVGAVIEDVADAGVVDAGGCYVIPGGIDGHTHFDLPVGAVRSADDFESGTLAAACGGTTCVVDFAGASVFPWSRALRVSRAPAAISADGGVTTENPVPEIEVAVMNRSSSPVLVKS